MKLIVNHANYIYNEGTALESRALSDVNLQIGEGEFIGFIGHTGCGKSTLMQLMNGLLKPTSGEVYFDGRDIHEDDFDKRMLRSKVGLVFQYPEHQLFEVDVFSDVCFGPRNLGLEQSEIELRAYEALKAVNFPEDSFYVSPFDLSGGEKRKVAIAGILAMKPEILILDEPTAGLDPKGRSEILELIKKLQVDSGITIILVSHSMEDVADYANRIVVMDKGSILLDDIPEKVFTEDKLLESIGLSVPAPARVLGKLRENGIPARAGAITVSEAADEIMRLIVDKFGGVR